ncbi:hypothetical protein BGZ51_009305 [Haplosporangium sp. Z 767]|nr:hypothetical protein BGZ51_009305 [Haplosporangium sp. Z 767]
MTSRARGYSIHVASAIQPPIKTIIDFARESEQHIVRLYYLPTPDTNGFTTTHTLVHYHDKEDAAALDDRPLSRARSSSTSALVKKSTRSSRGYTDVKFPSPSSSSSTSSSSSPSSPSRQIYQWTRVSESERGIVHLARLHISSLIIATSSIPYLSHLVSLRLQGNRLTELPQQIFRLPSLRELDVSQNYLTEIVGLIGMLAPTLEELFLQSNRLQSLPQQLGRLKRLRLLDIADNQLGCIPVEVQRLVSESFASERTNFWSMNDRSPTGSQSPIEPHSIPAPSQGAFNVTTNEEGGHDDDDYVQIRQGMKCWARGNRFWHVGVPWPSTASSSAAVGSPWPTGLAGSTLSSSMASPSSPAVQPLSPHSTYAGAPISALPFPSRDTQSFAPAHGFRNSQGHPQTSFGAHMYDDISHPNRRPQSNHHQYQDNYPGHSVDRRGYSKDSYTSCPWTLSLTDICLQIVGEKLSRDPHYYCYSNTCRAKKSRRVNKARHSQDRSSVQLAAEEYVDECAVLMMPEWTIEQLGLHDLSDIRKSLETFDEFDPQSSDNWSHGSYGAKDHSASGTYSSSQRNNHGHTTGDDAYVLKVSAPMQLTREEMDMECEYCSVCQKRLYFVGLRWKGVVSKRI